jgi:hypothetical protein
MCRFSFYTAFTISLAPIFRANMPLLHNFSWDSDFPPPFSAFLAPNLRAKVFFAPDFRANMPLFKKNAIFSANVHLFSVKM